MGGHEQSIQSNTQKWQHAGNRVLRGSPMQSGSARRLAVIIDCSRHQHKQTANPATSLRQPTKQQVKQQSNQASQPAKQPQTKSPSKLSGRIAAAWLRECQTKLFKPKPCATP